MKAGESPYRPQEVHEHSIPSNFVAQTYRIKVIQPVHRTDGSERFPVLYVTDADDFFDAIATQSSSLQTLGEVPRFILVGIGYEDAHAAQLFRWRDFATPEIRVRFDAELQRLADSLLLRNIDMKVITATTGANEFLRFIREELMPFIDARYPAIPADTNYYGYSAGGTFGLYTLFNQPETFKRYILGSPGTSYKGYNFGIDLAKAFIDSGKAMNAKVYMSVGELEEFKAGHYQLDLTSGYYLLAKFLKMSSIPGLDLTTRLFPDETHGTAWTLAFNHGVKALFGPASEVPYFPQFVEKK